MEKIIKSLKVSHRYSINSILAAVLPVVYDNLGNWDWLRELQVPPTTGDTSSVRAALPVDEVVSFTDINCKIKSLQLDGFT